MHTKIQTLKQNFLNEIQSIKNNETLLRLEKKYLGRKGEIAGLFGDLSEKSLEIKKKFGKMINELKNGMEIKAQAVKKDLARTLTVGDFFDETIAGEKIENGHLHPITQFIRKVSEVFTAMGFEICDGPEVELQKYNFDLLNIPRDHPARDLQDTFYLKVSEDPRLVPPLLRGRNRGGNVQLETIDENNLVLRTHTSPVQLRAMLERQPPVRLIAPGRVYRYEATDASHEAMFYQCEGLVIDQGIKITDLIGALDTTLKALFGAKTKIRVRPHYFPYTEPSLEVDMSCLICGQKGCSVCKKTGWLEMLGSGMVHPNVLKNMGVPYPKYTGFAFGWGLDRMMMLYYGVNDIRLSYSGDLRFLRQF